MKYDVLDAVIFDVDGTLYNQKMLRLRVFLSLLKTLCFHMDTWLIIKVLRSFRRHRESAAFIDAEASLESQYQWVAEATHLKIDFVRAVVEKWMFVQPLKHLGACQYPGVDLFFKKLKERRIMIGIFSDYPAKQKLTAMALEADCYVCSTDHDVRRLKPDPKGLLKCCGEMRVDPRKTLYIGDRKELDGACARAADIPYCIIPTSYGGVKRFYSDLAKEIKSV